MNKTIEYYNKNAEEYCDSTRNADMSFCCDTFLSYLEKDALILDVGCGSGRDSAYFINKGYRVVPMDPSSEICRIAAEYLGKKVLCRKAQEVEEIEAYDGIWACASLLHIPQNEMMETLKTLYMSLKPGGMIYVSFKYGDKQREKDGRLFSDYTEKSLPELMKGAGFSAEEVFITEDVRNNHGNERWVNGIFMR